MPLLRTARGSAGRTPQRPIAFVCAVTGVVSLFAGFAASCAASAGGYPDRIVRIIVPFPPGGGTDLITRRLGEAVAGDLGQAIIIENKPGAGTIIGTAAAAASPPDGYTLLMATFAHAVNPSLNAKLPYDTFAAFAPVALVARSFNIGVVNPQLDLFEVHL